MSHVVELEQMKPSQVETPYPLGAYVGQPDESNAANQAAFEQSLSSFSATMGASPQYVDTYVNYNDPISHWSAQNSFQATSWSATPALASSVPVIGLPLASTQDSAIQDYQAFASGQYDSMIAGMVQSWADAGVTTQDWRIGWEMNLTGPTYGGDKGSAQTAAWIGAYQHVYTAIHKAAAQDGVEAQVIWNPSVTSYSAAGNATTSFYPGSNYVDVIGADVYADAYPYSLYDFTTGKVDTSFSAWAQNSSNLTHYYNYPSATPYSNDGSSGHATSLGDLISLAEQTGKPLAVAETGAGNSEGGHDVSDNPTFVHWLSQTLAAAQGKGVRVDFVNIWDSNGGGDYRFSNASDGKPQEAAAWSEDFGAQSATFDPPCYVEGTLIRTDLGSVPVNCLQAGDLVVTASGELRPIRWLGHRRLNCRRHARPYDVMPIRIVAHAFGENRPDRDLLVSPGHSLCVDVIGEVLIPAIALVNGATIRQEDVDSVSYWHVELDHHEIILAENMPAESYLDMGNRDFFAVDRVVALDASPDAPAATHVSFCRPFHATGPLVDIVRSRLADRARQLDWRLDDGGLGDAHLIVDGIRLDPQVLGLSIRFIVPSGAHDVWLVSSTGVPASIQSSPDTRTLGLRIRAISVDDGFGEPLIIAIDDPCLCVGFHNVERDGDAAHRWTAGRARLPASLWANMDSDFFLRLDLAGVALPRWIAPSCATAPAQALSRSRLSGPRA